MPACKAGDLFAVPLSTGGHVTGRVLLDVLSQCFRPRRVAESSPLGIYNYTVLAEIYSKTSPSPCPDHSPVLLPGVFLDQDPIEKGRWPIVGFEAVDPDGVEFPETVNPSNMNMHFVRGEVMLPLAPGIENWQGILIRPSWIAEPFLPDICLHALGQTDAIDPRFLNVSRMSARDLRFHERRQEVYDRLGLDPNEPYAAFARRHGFETARFYSATA